MPVFKSLLRSTRDSRSSERSWIVANASLAGALMYLAPTPWMTWAVGSLAIIIAAMTVLLVGYRHATSSRKLILLDIATTWLPGMAGLALAIAGVVVIAKNPDSPAMRLGGLALFLIQILLIATAAPARVTATKRVDRRSTPST